MKKIIAIMASVFFVVGIASAYAADIPSETVASQPAMVTVAPAASSAPVAPKKAAVRNAADNMFQRCADNIAEWSVFKKPIAKEFDTSLRGKKEELKKRRGNPYRDTL